jgi:hypothetical protein
VGAFGGLAHGVWHSVGLADAHAYPAMIVTRHDCYPKLEAAAALYNFGNACDFDYSLIKRLFQSGLILSHFHIQDLIASD